MIIENYIMKTKQEYKIDERGCLYLLPSIPDKSIDMILTDLPYGTTACKWDTPIDLTKLWFEYERIIKDDGVIVLTASQPFTSVLIMSNIEMFKYDWIWLKSRRIGFLNAKIQPLRIFENVCIFYKNQCTYNPQMKSVEETFIKRSGGGKIYGNQNNIPSNVTNNGLQYPCNILKFKSVNNPIHSSQKPVTLFEYLIKTYTNEGDMVHDSCLGSGTTLEACLNTNRNCIGFEISDEWEHYYKERLKLNVEPALKYFR